MWNVQNKQIYRDRKQISGSENHEEWEMYGATADRCAVSLGVIKRF